MFIVHSSSFRLKGVIGKRTFWFTYKQARTMTTFVAPHLLEFL